MNLLGRNSMRICPKERSTISLSTPFCYVTNALGCIHLCRIQKKPHCNACLSSLPERLPNICFSSFNKQKNNRKLKKHEQSYQGLRSSIYQGIRSSVHPASPCLLCTTPAPIRLVLPLLRRQVGHQYLRLLQRILSFLRVQDTRAGEKGGDDRSILKKKKKVRVICRIYF